MNNEKFQTQCYVGNQLIDVVEHKLFFSKDAPARAQLTINVAAEPQSIIAIELGWGSNLRRVFTGYIERVAPSKDNLYQIFCRELAAILYNKFSVVMRHPTLKAVIDNLASQTGLEFVVPDTAYSNNSIPCFYSISNGYSLLDSCAAAFDIPDFIWQQQGDGRVFVGSWSDSYWSSRAIDIPNNFMQPKQDLKSAVLPCLPHLKPDVMLNGRRLSTVQHLGTETTITWT